MRKNKTRSSNTALTFPTANNIIEYKVGKDFFYSPVDIIRIYQQRIAAYLSDVEINNAAVAYRKGLCYFDFLEPHKDNYHFLRLDIISFFHSIPLDDIKDCLRGYFRDDGKLDDKLFNSIIKLITYTVPEKSKNEKYIGKKILPIGFVSSPIVSNIVFRKLDILIQKFCVLNNIIYTRYADDMLFSSPQYSSGGCFLHTEAFEREIAIILNIMKLKINKKKTLKANHTISLNGYTIQQRPDFLKVITGEIRLSNKKTNTIKKALYYIGLNRSPQFILKRVFNLLVKNILKYSYGKRTADAYAKDHIINKLCGYRSFILSIIMYHNKKKILLKDTLSKYSELVLEIEKAIEKISN